ncbi:helix-turn-helix transcriptional regulator [Vibrio natriegens]|uniref:helix-turn-helix transcriptional regulator n=1 Tax=Vibrio natriegens TaxID=691 RepID=UPI003555F50F
MTIRLVKPEQVLELIDDIYSAASDPVQWIPMAEKIQSSVGGHSVNFCLEDTRKPEFRNIYSNGVSLSDIELYEKKYIGRDNFTEIYETIPASSAILTQNVWDSTTLYQCFPYEEFYKNLGYAFFNCCLFYKDEEKRGWLSVVRSENDSVFTITDLEMMKCLTPHLKRAFLINMHLFDSKIAQQMCLDALEHLSAGVIFLSSNGQLVHSNSKAQKYLRNMNNMKQNFRVILPDNSANIALQKTISETLYSNKILLGRFIPFKEDDHQNMVICLPWRMNEQSYDWLNHQVGCLLFILPSSRTFGSPDRLMEAFDVSRAESHVLSGIVNGLSTKQLANKLCVSEATVRFHIKNLLRVFSSNNQVEMLSKVNKLLRLNVDF